MAQPQSKTSKIILSLPSSMTAKDVVTAVKAKGLKTTESNVYRVRRLGKKTAKKPAAAGAAIPARRRGRPRKASAAPSAAEDLLRAVAAELGLARAVEVLHSERAKVLGVIGR